MKIESLKGIIIIATATLIQAGCNMPGSKKETNQEYNEVIKLENRAKFLRSEGDVDSSIAYYRKSISLCSILQKQSNPATDTVYNRKIAHLNNYIGYMYDSLKKWDSALFYLNKSLQWANNSHLPYLVASDQEMIGTTYYAYGREKEKGSDERKSLYLNGVAYITAVIRNLDSLNLPEKKVEQYKMRLGAYRLNEYMYNELGDSDRKNFYINKLEGLSAQMYKNNL